VDRRRAFPGAEGIGVSGDDEFGRVKSLWYAFVEI
jgi:hypothetical protein